MHTNEWSKYLSPQEEYMSEKFLKIKISLGQTLLIQTKDVEQTIFLTKERISR